eukprot:13566788-Alexandrium_andersonii.AAC.1
MQFSIAADSRWARRPALAQLVAPWLFPFPCVGFSVSCERFLRRLMSLRPCPRSSPSDFATRIRAGVEEQLEWPGRVLVALGHWGDLLGSDGLAKSAASSSCHVGCA